MAITPEVYSLLKQANPARFEILRHLLAQVGIDSTAAPMPAMTACRLLTDDVRFRRNCARISKCISHYRVHITIVGPIL